MGGGISAKPYLRHHDWEPGIMGRVPQVDPDQLAALRRLRAAFGFVEVLAVIDDEPASDSPPAQGGLFDQERGEVQPSPEP
jgi:hypothetical protein